MGYFALLAVLSLDRETWKSRLMMTGEGIAALAPFGIILDEFRRCGAKYWGGGVVRLLAA